MLLKIVDVLSSSRVARSYLYVIAANLCALLLMFEVTYIHDAGVRFFPCIGCEADQGAFSSLLNETQGSAQL